ncbi:MAG TPA: hypothetical protein VI299_23595 [Polyangiales bacterium]
MRFARFLRIALCASLAWTACAGPAKSTRTVPMPVAADTAAADALLAGLGAGRCLVVLPGRITPGHVEQAAIVSQSDGTPYRLGLRAYVRAEQGRSRRTLLRFVSPPVRAVVQAALGEEQACLGDCPQTELAWLDPRTLRVQRGAWSEGESPCAALLHDHPRAFELAVREPVLGSSELRDTRVVLASNAEGIARVSTRRYVAEEAAERAWRAILRGQEELPTLAGVPADNLGERAGDRVVQRAFASFADLQLALDERARAVHPPSVPVDPADRDAVYVAFDAAPSALFEPLLVAARALSPADEGLRLRHFRLLFARDPRAALALAREAVGGAWALRARAALARFDEPALARALQDAHGLQPDVAARMARELYERSTTGLEDPAPHEEAAELTFLAARRIAAARVAQAPLSLRLPVLELPRLLATLAQSARPELALELRILAFVPAGNTRGAGRPATLWSSRDDAQAIAAGIELGRALGEGPFELRVELEAGRRATLALQGRRDGGWLHIDRGSRALRALRPEVLERLLAAPLRQMIGSTFPPDELLLEARDEAEAGEVEASASRVASCSREGLRVRCRGALADTGAARRALLGVAHDRLASEARALWSGTD